MFLNKCVFPIANTPTRKAICVTTGFGTLGGFGTGVYFTGKKIYSIPSQNIPSLPNLPNIPNIPNPIPESVKDACKKGQNSTIDKIFNSLDSHLEKNKNIYKGVFGVGFGVFGTAFGYLGIEQTRQLLDEASKYKNQIRSSTECCEIIRATWRQSFKGLYALSITGMLFFGAGSSLFVCGALFTDIYYSYKNKEKND